MAAALIRRGLFIRCFHRDLCRVVWRHQTALFSSKPSDRKHPRRTHIKKAKPQPAVDVAKLLEQLFSQRRPGTAPPAGKARPTKASSVSTKPPTSSSVTVSTSNVPPLSKTEPTVSVFPAASSFKPVDSFPKETPSVSPTNPKTSYSSETPQSPLDFIQGFAADSVSKVTATERQTLAETMETKVETVTVEPKTDTVLPPSAHMVEKNEVSSFSAAAVEPLIETTVESPAEPNMSPVETLEVRAQESGMVVVSHTAKEEPLIETTIDSPVAISHFSVETLESRAAAVEAPVEPTIVVTLDLAAETKSINSGVGNISLTATVEPLIEPTIEPAAERVQSTVENETADNLSHDALIQNAQESAPLPLKNEVESTIESTVESTSGNVAVEEGVSKSEQMTLESVTLHEVKVLEESLKTDDLLQIKSVLDEKAEQQLQELLVQTGTGAEYKAAAETENSSEDESEILTKALSKWDALSEDLQELEGESYTLVNELLFHVPAVLSQTPCSVKTGSASDPDVGANAESLQMEEKGTEAETMTLESITLSKVKAEVGGLETEVLLEIRNALEKEAEVLAKEEKMEVETMIEDVAVFEDTTEAEILTLDSVSEATDAIEAETSVMLEAMFGSEQGPRQPPDTLLVPKPRQQDEATDQEAKKESAEQEGSVLEAMTLESVTLAEVEASLGTLENESLSETTDYLEKEAEILAGEKKIEMEDEAASEETTEDLRIESLSLPEVDALSEALQTDALMEELLFSVPGLVTSVTGGLIGREAVRENILDAATVATGSVDVDTVAAETDFPASPALKDELLGQEVEEEEEGQTEALGNEHGKGTHTDLDPVQRLFLEKIREYDNMCRLNGGLLEAEPDYQKYLSEEITKLQRLYGGGDLSSFPEFTFTEPKMDQDSK